MRRLLLVGCLIICSLPTLWAQPDRVYRSLDDVEDPEQVYSLRLRWKRYRSIPQEVFAFKNLRHLDLSRNSIDTIPPDIALLTHLESLNMSRNLIRVLPDEIGLLTRLQSIDLSRNPIETLPETMAFLPALTELILWSTNITRLPAVFAELNGTLEVLDLRSCSLTLDEQDSISKVLPAPRKLWDQACNCR